MSFGVSDKSMEMIKQTLTKRKEVEKASVFGSRGMGNYKTGSDIDLAIYGVYITDKTVSEISNELNEALPIPYYIDVVHYESLQHEGLKEHINQFGKCFYP